MASVTAPSPSSALTVPPPRDGRIIGRVSARLAGGAALLAGALSLVSGVLQIVFPQDEDPSIDPRTRVILVMFTLSLWAFAVLFVGLARYARSSWGAYLAAAGTVLLTTGTVSSAINGIDLDFFPVVAMAANALWLIGAIALTVSLARAKRVSLWLVLPIPFIQLTLVFFSQLGGGVLTAVYLLILGAVLVAGRVQSRARRRRGA